MNKAFYMRRMKEVGATRALRKLHKHLLTLGGDWVVPQEDTDEANTAILTSGVLVTPSSPRAVMRVKGEPSKCHANCAVLWLSTDEYSLHTGYALHGFDDQVMWRQHSWLMKGGKIVETTEVSKAYFGMELTGTAALRFAAGNISSDRVPKLTEVKNKMLEEMERGL